MVARVIAAPKLDDAIMFKGESGRLWYAVKPIGELSRPLLEYFPGQNIDAWFERSEQWRKRSIREKFLGRGAVRGERNPEVHEIIPQGMGERKYTLAPWNMIPVSRLVHRLLQSHSWTVVRYDMLAYPDPDGIIITDIDGKRISVWWNLSMYEKMKRMAY